MTVLVVGPVLAQTANTGRGSAPGSDAGSGAASPAPTTPKPEPAPAKPGPAPPATTSIETEPSKGVPGSPLPGSDPVGPLRTNPAALGLTDAEQVRNLQQALKNRGMHPGPVDGVVSPETQAAIRAFQRDQKVPATGRLDSQTREKLGMSP